MREVKSVFEKIHRKLKFDGNLRIGGTDHRERKFDLSKKKIEKRGKKRMIVISH